jgi:hypothetical protein
MKTCKKTKRKIILYIKKTSRYKTLYIIYKKSFEKLLVDLIINIFKILLKKNPRDYLSIK